MGWFRREAKEVDETKEVKDTNETKDNDFVSDFDRKYKVDQNGNYKYHETSEDPTKNQKVEKKTENNEDDDDEMDQNRTHKKIEDDYER